MPIKFLIIIPPQRTKATSYPPFGALYVAASLIEEGHQVQLLNIDVERIDFQEVMRRIDQFSPDIIGITGIVSTVYKYVKGISKFIRNELPEVKLVLGGSISAAAEIVLQNTEIDVVVMGEGEITVKELAECLTNGGDLNKVNGIMFRDSHCNIVSTPPREQIKNLDDVPYPAFELLDMTYYLGDPMKIINVFRNAGYEDVDPRFFEPHRQGKKLMVVQTSRGCTHRCTFCQRHMIGIRMNSFDYLFNYLEYLMDKYNVGFFSLGAELFLPSKRHYRQFLDEKKKRNLDIIYFITGARVNTVDEEILKGLKESGCWMIEYGFESGSQKMLDVMEKGITLELNVAAVKATIAAGLYTIPGIIIGMPGETPSTIRESINTLKSLNLNWHQTYINYPIALPGSPLYDYALLKGLIPDEEKYLENVSEIVPGELSRKSKSSGFINYTEWPDDVVKGWKGTVVTELEMHYIKNKLKGNFFVNYFKTILLRRKRTFLFILKRDGIGKGLMFSFSRIREKVFHSKRIVGNDQEMTMNYRKTIDNNIPEKIEKNSKGEEIIRSVSLRKVIKMYGEESEKPDNTSIDVEQLGNTK